ncbi:MAG: fatty acid hydroxylase superfamily-domain-containing protein [Benniella sp.]|nr:MAG: fatty acid hydroxylase superfamily-domain-containing protein [Benniella sp.]
MTVIKVAESLGRMFYVVSPKATTFGTEQEVPPYVADATHWFIFFIVAELLYYIFKDKGNGLKRHDGKWEQGKYRMNDMIGSLGAGSIQQMSRFFLGSLQMVTYNYIWDNYRIESIAFDTFKLSTWIGCFIGVDFAYYWFHRAAHEVNIFWAGHSVHHSSEYYNVTTALRQSLVQTYASFFFNLPLALVFSPAQFAVHTQLNLLYQFWIHTEIVPRLGWLEYIINTPSAHRLHHGRNPYCIDKNYAGTLIIWDRMFGTYADERVYPDVVDSKEKEEPVAYGLTHPINTFDPVAIQLGHFKHIWNMLWITPGIGNKFKVVFYGPGWHPGVPRTGLLSEIPDIDLSNPPVKYDPVLPSKFNYYIGVHFAIISIVGSWLLADGFKILPLWQTQAISVAFLISLIALSKIMDAKPYGLKAELVRTLGIFFLAEFVARSGYYEQTYWERRGTLLVADTFFVSSVFLGWNIYKLGPKWTHIEPVAKAHDEKEKVKTN